MKLIRVINILLIVLAIVLAIKLIQPDVTSNIIYNLDDSAPECYFNNNGESSEIPAELCCLELQKQLTCKQSEDKVKCYTSETGAYYSVNYKMLNYCKLEGYDAKIS